LTPSRTPEDFFRFNFGYDVVEDSERIMREDDPNWRLPEAFVGGGGGKEMEIEMEKEEEKEKEKVSDVEVSSGLLYRLFGYGKFGFNRLLDLLL
jgi:hypothetical protein